MSYAVASVSELFRQVRACSSTYSVVLYVLFTEQEQVHGDTMDIDNDEKETQHKSNKEKKTKVVTMQMQPSVKTFGAEKSKRQEYPKNDKVMITDALSDVRVK